MLVLTRGKEEAVAIGTDVVVKVLRVQGDRVVLGIEAPDSVRVRRLEVPATDGPGRDANASRAA